MLSFNQENLFEELESNRLIFRNLTMEDSKSIEAIRSDPKVNNYIDRPSKITEAEALEFIGKVTTNNAENKSYYWAIELKDTKKVIGTICIFNYNPIDMSAEIGFELMSSEFRKGYIFESVTILVLFAKNKLKLKSLDAIIHKDNIASTQLVLKIGFEQNLRKSFSENNEYRIFTKFLK